MPESQEVKLIAECVKSKFINMILVNYGMDTSSKFYKYPIDGISQLSNVNGWKLTDVTTHGKKILFHLSKNDELTLDTNLIVLSSLGMEGKWLYQPEKHSNFWLDFGVMVGKFRIIDRLYFDDSRHFGNVEVHTKESLEKRLKSVGADFASGTITLTDFKAKITTRLQKKAIFGFLMDQKYFSGLGAYLTAESLYESGISPLRSLGTLSDSDIQSLLVNIQKVLGIAKVSNGLTIATFHTAEGTTGSYPCKAYGKKLDPNGNDIIKVTISGRTAHYSPKVQS